MSEPMTRKQLLALLRRQCDKAGSQKAWAKAHGLSTSYLSDVLTNNRAPGWKILKALGVTAAVTYRRIR